ncbi:MscL family protein [Nocardia arizonensis]
MLESFENYLSHENVAHLPVAVVIGASFVAIVSAFTNGVINPILAASGGQMNSAWVSSLLPKNRRHPFRRLRPLPWPSISSSRSSNPRPTPRSTPPRGEEKHGDSDVPIRLRDPLPGAASGGGEPAPRSPNTQRARRGGDGPVVTVVGDDQPRLNG